MKFVACVKLMYLAIPLSAMWMCVCTIEQLTWQIFQSSACQKPEGLEEQMHANNTRIWQCNRTMYACATEPLNSHIIIYYDNVFIEESALLY